MWNFQRSWFLVLEILRGVAKSTQHNFVEFSGMELCFGTEFPTVNSKPRKSRVFSEKRMSLGWMEQPYTDIVN